MKKILVALLASLASTIVEALLKPSLIDLTYFFTFGDSYSSTGFSVTAQQPSTANPLGNPDIGDGTIAGGPNWVAYLTIAHNKSLIYNYDLAVSGAVIDNNIVANPGFQYDLVYQVSLFKQIYANKASSAPWDPWNSVFGIFIGINDVGNAYGLSNTSAVQAALLSRYYSLVEDLYGYGARRFFFINVPPTSRTPLFESRGNTTVQLVATFENRFNKGIQDMTAEFHETHQDTTVVLYDDWTFMSKVLDDPTVYGYANASAASCYNSDGSTCIWWNNYHPGYVFDNLMAEDLSRHLGPFWPAWG